MKEYVKKLFLCLFILFSFTLVSCGNSENLSTLSKVKQSKKLILGTCADYPPYEFHKKINGKDTIVGFDIDVAKAIAKNLNVELEIKDMKFEGLLPSLDSGNIDLIIAGMTPTKEREKNVNFTQIYYTAKQSIIVKTTNLKKFNSINDLKNYCIGVQKGSVQEQIIKTKCKNSEIRSLPKITDLILALNTNKVQAILLEKPVADTYVKNDSNISISNIKIENANNGNAIAVRKNSKDFTDELNKIISNLKKTNKLNEFIVNNVNLQN